MAGTTMAAQLAAMRVSDEQRTLDESDLAAGRKVRELLVVTGYDSGRYAVEYV